MNKSSKRGIYQFSKALVLALCENNYKLSLITQVYNTDDTNLFLKDLQAYQNNPKKYFLKDNSFFKLFLNFAKFYFSRSTYTQIIFDRFDFQDEIFNCFTSFLNQPSLYYRNNIELLFSDFLIRDNMVVKQFSTNDILFTTSPLVVKSSKHKVVQTVHDLIPVEENSNYKKYFLKRLTATCNSDKVLCVSKYTQCKYLELFPHMQSRTAVIYPCLPADNQAIFLSSLPDIQQAVLDKYNLKKNNYMYYVGEIERRKNIHNLIDAYIIATKADKTIPLVVSGRIVPSYSKEFNLDEYLVDFNDYSHSKHNVFKTGFVNDIEKLCLIRNCRAFLFPSLSEGFGIPVLEAQSLAVPVLTSNNSSLSEVVADSALLLDNPLNIDELVFNIEALWSDNDLCRSLSQKGLINSDRFSKANFTQAIDHFLANI